MTTYLSLAVLVLISTLFDCRKDADSSDLTITKLTTNWLWTKDDRGGGSQQSLRVEDDTVTILPVWQHVHFVNKDNILGSGIYTIKFKGNSFAFAWRISPQNSTAGTGLILENEGEMMSLIHVSWTGFFYGWHNSYDQFRNQIPFKFAGDVWHHVTIDDKGANLSVTFDGQVLNFFGAGSTPVDSFLADVAAGYQGIGNGTTVVKYFDLKYTSQ